MTGEPAAAEPVSGGFRFALAACEASFTGPWSWGHSAEGAAGFAVGLAGHERPCGSQPSTQLMQSDAFSTLLGDFHGRVFGPELFSA